MAGRHESAWTYNYTDLMKLTGRQINAIHQASSRGSRGAASGFDPSDFGSVVRWVFRNATDEFKLQLMQEMKFFRTERGLARTPEARKKKAGSQQ